MKSYRLRCQSASAGNVTHGGPTKITSSMLSRVMGVFDGTTSGTELAKDRSGDKQESRSSIPRGRNEMGGFG